MKAAPRSLAHLTCMLVVLCRPTTAVVMLEPGVHNLVIAPKGLHLLGSPLGLVIGSFASNVSLSQARY